MSSPPKNPCPTWFRDLFNPIIDRVPAGLEPVYRLDDKGPEDVILLQTGGLTIQRWYDNTVCRVDGISPTEKNEGLWRQAATTILERAEAVPASKIPSFEIQGPWSRTVRLNFHEPWIEQFFWPKWLVESANPDYEWFLVNPDDFVISSFFRNGQEWVAGVFAMSGIKKVLKSELNEESVP